MISFILFLMDLIALSIFDQWIFNFLLVGFIINQLKKDYKIGFFGRINFYIIFLLLEDFIQNDRFGLAFSYIIPIILLAYLIRLVFLIYFNVFHYILLVLALFIEVFLVKQCILHKMVPWYSTMYVLSINIISMCVFLIFRNFIRKQGNRFLSGKNLAKRGKSGLQTG